MVQAHGGVSLLVFRIEMAGTWSRRRDAFVEIEESDLLEFYACGRCRQFIRI